MGERQLKTGQPPGLRLTLFNLEVHGVGVSVAVVPGYCAQLKVV